MDIHKIKAFVTLDKQIYAGFNILDLSKDLMYQFHYKYIEKNAILTYYLLSFIYLLYFSLSRFLSIQKFVWFSWPSKRFKKCFNYVNKNVIGKIKDEFKGKRISEFIVLKSKMHSLNKKAKGVSKNVVKNIRHKEYIKWREFKANYKELELDVCTFSLFFLYDNIYIRWWH